MYICLLMAQFPHALKIYINEFFIKIGFFDDEKRIEELFNLYIDLIKKSNIFFIQELQIISHTLIDSLTISDLHLQYNIIFYILEFFLKNIKKSRPKNLSFKFNTFKIHINREIKIVVVKIFLDSLFCSWW